MRLTGTLRLGFALLLALLLPLQGYAVMPSCAQHEPSAAVAGSHAAAALQHHCGTAPAVTHRHDCGSCCGAAIALAQAPWVAPPRAVPESSSAAPSSPPKRLLDRLDRPPRTSRA